MREHGLPKSAKLLRQLKAAGFSDARLATLSGQSEAEVRALRQRSACSPSSSASTPAPPSSPRRPPTCIRPTRRRSAARSRTRRSPSDKTKVIILGGGPNRIGQGIEFDYCCCHAAFALDEAGFEVDHGQLQSGDRLDRLRHLRPALFRAAHGGGCSGDRARRAVARKAPRRDRAVRRADAAETRRRAAGGERADPRHVARHDRPRRGSRAFSRA